MSRRFMQNEFLLSLETRVDLVVVEKAPETDPLGKAVLLIHGSGVGWIYWDIPFEDYSVMDYLAARGLHVYAVECRGYGRSTKPNGLEVTATTIAKDTCALMHVLKERTGHSRFSVVGHSSGGTVAVVTAGLCPRLIERMVLIGTPYRQISQHFMPYAESLAAMVREPGKDYVPNLHYQDVERRLNDHDPAVVAWYKKAVAEAYAQIPGGIFPDLLNNPGLAVVKRLEVPTMLLNGSSEYVVDASDVEAMFSDLKVADKANVVLPGGHHLLFLEKRGHKGLQESLYSWLTRS